MMKHEVDDDAKGWRKLKKLRPSKKFLLKSRELYYYSTNEFKYEFLK